MQTVIIIGDGEQLLFVRKANKLTLHADFVNTVGNESDVSDVAITIEDEDVYLMTLTLNFLARFCHLIDHKRTASGTFLQYQYYKFSIIS